MGELQKLNLRDKAITPVELKSSLEQFLSHTWVEIESIWVVLEYTSGRTTGATLSDLVCTVSVAVVLRSARENLRSTGLPATFYDVPQVWPQGRITNYLEFAEIS